MLPRLMLRGLVATFAVSDLFEWLDRRGVSGTVFLEREDINRRLVVDNGVIVKLTSSHPAEHLGRVLVGAGYVTDEQLAMVYRAGESLGQSLVMRNLIAEDELRGVLETKILEGAYELMSWKDGSFVVEPGPVAPAGDVPVAVALAHILIDGPARAALWQAYRERIPSDDVRFRAISTHSTADELVQDVGRGLSVRELMLERNWLPFATYRRLAELVEQGEIVALREGEGAQSTRIAASVRAVLGRPVVPRLVRSARELATYDLTGNERALLARIDGFWDAALLVRTAPGGELETLATFERLLARGLIRFDEGQA
jgi:Domain of unknown function (DUF4388)